MAETFTVVAKITPRPGKEDALQAILFEQVEAVRKNEPDCLVYRVHRSAKAPVTFLFYEQYRSAQAFDFHRKAPHLAAFHERRKDLVAGPAAVELYSALTS